MRMRIWFWRTLWTSMACNLFHQATKYSEWGISMHGSIFGELSCRILTITSLRISNTNNVYVTSILAWKPNLLVQVSSSGSWWEPSQVFRLIQARPFWWCCHFCLFWGSETGSQYVTQAGLHLWIFLPQPLVLGLQMCTTTLHQSRITIPLPKPRGWPLCGYNSFLSEGIDDFKPYWLSKA